MQSAKKSDDHKKDSKTRIYYLDKLRIIGIIAVFLIHVAKIFDLQTTSFFYSTRSISLSYFREFILAFVMPMFFIISGAATYFSLKNKTGKTFLKTRVKRLIIPLVLAGTLLMDPIYVYAEKIFNGLTTLNYFQWYPTFFTEGFYLAGGNFTLLGMGTPLWYLLYLFIFSLVLLPLLVKKTDKDSVMKRISAYFEKPAALFLLFIPVAVISFLVEYLGLGFLKITGKWDLFSYIFFFLYGYIIYSNKKIQEVIKKYGAVSFIVGIILICVYVDSHFGTNLFIEGITRHASDGSQLPLNLTGWALSQAFRAIASWILLLGIIGMSQRFLNKKTRFLDRFGEAVLPFYIMHNAIILIVAYYLLNLGANVLTKFLMISVVSFIIIMTLYEMIIKRFNLFRFIFGMKSNEKLSS